MGNKCFWYGRAKEKVGFVHNFLFILVILSTSCGETSFFASSTTGQSQKLEKSANGKIGSGQGRVGSEFDAQAREALRDDILGQCTIVGPQKTVTETLVFPATKECAFGQNGNLPERDQFFQGRVEQMQKLSIPADHVICDMNINSKTRNLHYDDFFVLAIENNILVSTNDAFTIKELPSSGNSIFEWDFGLIKGKPWSDNDKYCFGDGSTCRIPSHDEPGALALKISKIDFVDLSVELFNLKEIDIQMVTLGDNDEGDCEHSHLELDLELTIAPAGK